MIVFARSMGFVASTARQDASAEFGMETQPGNCSLFVFRVTASRLGSVSVLRRFGDDALDIAFERARRSRASDAVEGIARAARASGDKKRFGGSGFLLAYSRARRESSALSQR